jgi:CRP-like cAMP-binding protein
MYIENRLLAALPQRKYARLFAKLQPVTLNLRHIVAEQGMPVRYIYFPTTAMISLLSMSDDREKGIGISAIGDEGMLGLTVFLGDGVAPGRGIVQLAGSALRVEAKIFKEAVGQGELLSNILCRYAQVQFKAITCSVFCSRFHKVDARLAQWLLMTHDKARSDTFPLTQEFAASLLGLHRPAATIVAHKLQASGLIRYSRGQITILSRQGLEALACECYVHIKSEYARLLDDLLPALS